VAVPAPSKHVDGRQEGSAREAVYRELVTVTGSPQRGEVSAGGHRSLASNELLEFGSHVADDPLRVVQALPGVAAGDDFRSEYSVRGSPYRHAALVVDGVVTPFLQHAAPGRGAAGTLTMFPADTVEEATLLVGAYPRRNSSQLGPQLILTLREG
jgi:hypothetical protein